MANDLVVWLTSWGVIPAQPDGCKSLDASVWEPIQGGKVCDSLISQCPLVSVRNKDSVETFPLDQSFIKEGKWAASG